MSDREFVDTNILVYAYDRSAGLKHERARRLLDQLWESGNGTLSTQVLQEFAVYLRRKVAHPLSAQETRRVLQDFMSWNVFVNTSRSIFQALEVEERFQISFWDALIIQAAEAAGAKKLYTEDLSDGQRYGEVLVVNPLR